MAALAREEVDLVISSDPETLEGITFNPLFDYSPTFIAASTSPLAQKPFVVAEDFADQTVITSYSIHYTKLYEPFSRARSRRCVPRSTASAATRSRNNFV